VNPRVRLLNQAKLVRVDLSTTNQGRRNSEPLNPLKDRTEQTTPRPS
jgi:hypothetical protein